MTSATWHDARIWRMRAAEIRALADEMKEAEPKAIMLSIVADYYRLAQWAEKSLSGRTSSAGPELTRGGREDMKGRLTFARTEKHLKWVP